MENSTIIFWLLGLVFVLGILWILAFARAVSQIMTNAFFGDERPLAAVEFWRYLFNTTLFLVVGTLVTISLSRYSLHNQIYRYPVSVVRLISVNFIAGPLIATLSWLFFKMQMRRMAKFYHPNLSAWKGIGFLGPKKRRMTLEERTEYLLKMDFMDYLKALGLPIIFFASLPWFLFWFALEFQAPMQGFRSVISSFFGPMIPCEIILALVGFIFGTVAWLGQRLFVWLGWVSTLV